MKKKFTRILGVGLTIALLTSLMVTAVPVMALSQPTVSIATGQSDISYLNADYTVIVTLGKDAEVGDNITITFPTDTTVATSINGSLSSGPGWVAGTWDSTPTATATFVGDSTERTVVATVATEAIGEAAQVRIAIYDGITNPTAAGSYTLTVKTTDEPTAVESASYTIKTPTITPLEGIVEVYNPSDVLMTQETGAGAITTAIGKAGKDYTIKIGPGVYDDETFTGVTYEGLTFAATGAASETIIKDNFPIDMAKTTIDGLTIRAKLITVTAGTSTKPVTIKNCVLDNDKGTSGVTLVEVQTGGYLKLEDSTLDVSAGTKTDTVVSVTGGTAKLSGCTITLGDSTDKAISSAGTPTVDVDECTITGASGVGYQTNNGTGTITDSTFDGLEKGIYATAAADLTIRGNTIKNGTNPSTTVYGAGIKLDDAKDVLIEKNDIQDNAGYSVQVGSSANVTAISVMGNSLVNNSKGLTNGNSATNLNAKLNWWGSNTGPTITANPGGTGDKVSSYVTYKPWANATVPDLSTGSCAAYGAYDKSTTIGVSYESDTATTGITLANYASNPAALAPPLPALAGGYYDVYSPSAAGTNTIKFYNAAIDENTLAYYWSSVAGGWVECSKQGVAGTGAFVWVTVGTIGGVPTQPSNAELGGTPFALVESEPAPPAVEILSPAIGSYDVPVQPMFTWNEAEGAIRYEIALGEDPIFAIIDWSYNVDGTFYKAVEELHYSTTYYWRVRALTAEPYLVGRTWITPAGPWSTGIFTTEAEPVAVVEEAPEITVETPTVTVNPPEVSVTTEAAVPPVILWTIVGIGAVLIVALIVLIVRTRRVA